MSKCLRFHLRQLGLPALFGAYATLSTTVALAQTVDISPTPLASASSLTVLPNLMFTLDDSGSMASDHLGDNTGRDKHEAADKHYSCKKRSNGENYCNRGDPPLFAHQYNTLNYNPQVYYRPAVYADGTSFPSQTSWSGVDCDPFSPNWTCKRWYQDNYDTIYDIASNPVGEWYGTGNTFDIRTQFPEIVYCTNSTGDVNNPDQCRRNGLSNATDKRQTGNPFRYTNALGANGWRTAYPEANATHEFWRPSSGSTVTVTTSYPHDYPTSGSVSPGGSYPTLATPFQVIVRNTGTGTGGSGFENGGTAESIAVTTANQFTYTQNSGQRLAGGELDWVVAFKNGTTGGTRQTVYVTAPAHGLNPGDQIRVFSSNLSIACSNGATVTVLTSPTPTANTFAYTGGCAPSSPMGVQVNTYYQRTTLFNVVKLKRGGPLFYEVAPVEHCSDVALINCIATPTPSGAYVNPAPLRYCLSGFDANRLDTPTGNERTNTKPRCQAKYDAARSYVYPRYGSFTRTDIIPGSGTYAGRPLRTDCSAGNCTGDQEMTNFANWFAYYRTRMLTMKTAAGIAFSPIDNRYRVGFVTINPGSPVMASRYLKIADFDVTHKQNWYTKFYAQTTHDSTPLREALARVGRHYAKKTDGINNGMPDDPVQYSCQQNFLLLTTDGYWNGNSGKRVDSSNIGNVDNVVDASKNPRPFWDGANPYDPDGTGTGYSSSDTLADTALYYWQTDLRPTGAIGALGAPVFEDNVPTGDKDKANWQHMTTFALGLVDGLMFWRRDYESAGDGDYYSIKNGENNKCSWATGICNWPTPGKDTPAALDDLWHAAVNGRGTYFNASNPTLLQDGLNDALANLTERSASGAAAATSTPNITTTDRLIFKSTYTTVKWNGEIVAQLIDPNTGDVITGDVWSAKTLLQGRVGPSSDTRTIYLYDAMATDRIKPFNWTSLGAAEKTWFTNKCVPLSSMSQCTLLNPLTTLLVANNGQNMVNFLRGQTQHEAGSPAIYRDRQFALGDTVNATPLFVGKPRLLFGDAVTPTYTDFAGTWAGRKKMLYVGANDGMLHAFNADTGDEVWAFVPRTVAPNMWRLAEDNYATKHRFFVDGSPAFMDVYDVTTSNWRTILVGGLNSGGRGYYAVDITNPDAPKGLWEFCNDATLCAINDPNLGLTYGNPVITKRASDGKWVVLVTSGYNNITPGDGRGYLYVLDAITGAILQKVGTGAGSSAAPSNLGRINAWIENFYINNTTKWVYGGDMQGNIFKFDLTVAPATVKRIGRAVDASGKAQPITTKPELGLINDTHKVVYVGTGRYLGAPDLTDPATHVPPDSYAWQQSIYAIKDKDTDYGNLRDPANGFVEQTITELAGGDQRTVSSNAVDWGADNGWYVDLNPADKSPGERVNVDPQLVLGTLVVATNIPGSSVCTVGGDSWVYQFDYRSGTFVKGSPSNLVAKKQSGAITVGVVIYQLKSGSIVGQVQRSETTMRKEDINTNPSSDSSRRTSWREIAPE